MKKRAVVAGGGVVGLLSALLLKDRFEEVVLVEKSSSVGGLLKSELIEDNYFDIGTHILAETGLEDLDKILFKDFYDSPESWYELPFMNAANFYNGKLNENSPLIDLASLAPDLHYRCC
ncbi:MAG: NAD(P)-binding protein, partial [Lentisphaeraceae bacterium]|nr:NAD(P)-binding protein [Lentisphaeraceae bacterium]